MFLKLFFLELVLVPLGNGLKEGLGITQRSYEKRMEGNHYF